MNNQVTKELAALAWQRAHAEGESGADMSLRVARQVALLLTTPAPIPDAGERVESWLAETQDGGSTMVIGLAQHTRIVSTSHPRTTVVPEGYVLMPVALTAENGAKSALSGNFKIHHKATCSGCYYDEADPECEVCGGDVEYTEIVTLDWTTIKEVYAESVELLAVALGDGQ